MGGLPGGIGAVFRLPVLKMGGLSAAVNTHDIPALAVLFLQQSCSAAERAVLQGKLFVNVHDHILQSTEIRPAKPAEKGSNRARNHSAIIPENPEFFNIGINPALISVFC